MFGDGVSVVITSINPPREKLFDFIELGRKVIVVGDKKTPDSQWNEIDNTNLHFLSRSSRLAPAARLIDWTGFSS